MIELLYFLIGCEVVVIIILLFLLHLDYHASNSYDSEASDMSHMTGYYQGYRDSLLDSKNVILSKGRELREDDLVEALDNHDEMWGRIFKKYKD